MAWLTNSELAPWSSGKATTKRLPKLDYAKTQRPKELLPGRTNLSADWLDTACKAVRPPNAPFQVRRGCSGRNVLWLVDDLVAHFKS